MKMCLAKCPTTLEKSSVWAENLPKAGYTDNLTAAISEALSVSSDAQHSIYFCNSKSSNKQCLEYRVWFGLPSLREDSCSFLLWTNSWETYFLSSDLFAKIWNIRMLRSKNTVILSPVKCIHQLWPLLICHESSELPLKKLTRFFLLLTSSFCHVDIPSQYSIQLSPHQRGLGIKMKVNEVKRQKLDRQTTILSYLSQSMSCNPPHTTHTF